MIVFADYGFYTADYLKNQAPTVEMPVFDFYAQKATNEINRLTFGNIAEPVDERVKMCCCELAELLFGFDENEKEQGGVTAESVGGWSKSYENGESRRQLLSQKIKSCVRSWLSGTGLLFGGVEKC